MQQQVNPATGDLIHAQAIADFYNGHIPDEVASQKEGRPIYRDKVMIRIRWAGDSKKEFHAPADDRGDRPVRNKEDNTRFYPKWKDHPDFKPAYDAFIAGQAFAANGTPIAELPFLTEARRAELKAINIFTAEQLVAVDPMTKLGSGLSDLRRQAQTYLDRARGAAVDAQYAAREKAMQDELADLRQKLDALLSGNPQPAPAATSKPKLEVSNASPFDSFSDEELRGWLTEANGGQAPHNRCSRATLIKMATARNEELRRQNEGVAPEAAAA